MAKRYDPILCMMVDEPTKAHDAKKEEGFKILSATIRGEKLVLTFEDLLNSPGKKETMEFTKKEAEAFKKDPWNTWTGNTKSIVEKFIGGKVHDAEFQMYGPEFHHPIIKASSKEEAIKKAKEIYGWGGKVEAVKVSDSASALDEAIKTCDGMFQQIFGKYSSAAKQHYDRAVKELDSFKGEIKDYLTLAGKWEMQIRNDLARIDEAYNVAGNDYYAARREIQETMDSLTQVMLRKAREKRK